MKIFFKNALHKRLLKQFNSSVNIQYDWDLSQHIAQGDGNESVIIAHTITDAVARELLVWKTPVFL